VTRFMAGRARVVFTGFPTTAAKLRRQDNVQVVGTPVRHAAGRISRSEALERFGLSSDKRTLLILGGSLGAASINQAILEAVDRLAHEGIQLLWQTGRFQDAVIQKALAGRAVGWVGPFIDDMDSAYAAADLAVCRAGAATIAELTATGTPAILVPYPRAAEDHQTMNARAMERSGAATMLPDSELAASLLPHIVQLLGDADQRTAMHRASLALAKSDAARVIATTVVKLAE